MSTLQNYLQKDLGIHPDVIELLCSREVPKNNAYWKGRKTYVSQSPGYLFIPIYLDLLLKSNVGVSVLSEAHLLLIEKILHSAACQEAGNITYMQHHQECQNILRQAGIAEAEIRKIEEALINRPFTLFPEKYKSLRRANSFLYSTALFPNHYDLCFHYWESVMPLFLFLDDLTDLAEDLANKSENCLLDSPSIENNFFALHSIIAVSIKPLEIVNSKLYHELNKLRQEAVAITLGGVLLSGSKN
jgi:hypothetical protein